MVKPSGLFLQLSLGRAETFFDFRAGDGKNIQPGAALCFVGFFDGGENPGGHGRAQVRGNQTGFQLLKRVRRQFGRRGDDAFDLMSQFGMSFVQALPEFLKQAHAL